MPSLSITRQHIARAAGAHNGVVGEESGDVCVCVCVRSARGRVGGDSARVAGVTEGKTRGGDISRGALISAGD